MMFWGRSRRALAVAESFVSAVNGRDAAALAALTADDFTYVDSWREGVSGREQVAAAFAALAAADPDFGMEVDRMDWRDPHVLMTGRVNSGKFGIGRRAVWQVLVVDGKVAEFQAWAEGGPPPLARMLEPDGVVAVGDSADERPGPGGES